MNMVIDAPLVARLIAQQFPHLRDLPVAAVKNQGWDNRTFRLGDTLSVRLPSDASYAAAVQKESVALDALATCLSVAIPAIVAIGEPSGDYPLPWSIRRWIPGTTLEATQVTDRSALARALGAVLVALRAAPPVDALRAGKHSFFRGCHPGVYGDEVVQSLDILKDQIDTRRCLDIWQNGIASHWEADPVWFHGDMAVGNILMSGDRISALIDFGTCGIGDPACDFAIAWTCFDAGSRPHFKDAIRVDDGTWQRAKAWALWKALVSLAGLSSPDADGLQARALAALLAQAP